MEVYTKSLYSFLNSRGVTFEIPALLWWTLPMPSKIRVFMLLVAHNAILAKDNLIIRGWEGPLTCQFLSTR